MEGIARGWIYARIKKKSYTFLLSLLTKLDEKGFAIKAKQYWSKIINNEGFSPTIIHKRKILKSDKFMSINNVQLFCKKIIKMI